MIKALVFCKAGLGTSMLLKIKVDKVIIDNRFPIKTEGGNLDSIKDFDGDLIITMKDIANQINSDKYVIGIKDILDKNEIKEKLVEYLNNKDEN